MGGAARESLVGVGRDIPRVGSPSLDAKPETWRASGKLAIVLCVILNVLDGFDIMAIAFAAPSMAAEWSLRPVQVGTMLAAGLAGMIAGSLCVSPFADRLGRRPVTIACVVVTSLGMLGTAAAPNLYVVAAARFVTGMSLGGLSAALIAMVVENATDRSRALAMGFLTAGFSFGGLAGGLVSSYILVHYRWSDIFLFGGIAGLLTLPWLIFKLPESKASTGAPQTGVRGRVNTAAAEKRWLMSVLFSPQYRIQTIMLAIVQFCHFVTFYYLTGWAPSIVVSFGHTPQEGALVAAALSGGAIVAGLSVGWVANRIGIKRLLTSALLASSFFVVSLAAVPITLATMTIFCFVIGFFFMSANMSFYTALACAYEEHARVTATGFVVGVGRLGAVVGPPLAGALIEGGVAVQSVIAVMGLGSLVAGLTMSRLRLRDTMAEG